MPWVRIDEKAMEHPKVAGLPDGAFRLWVQGLAHCQKFLTDGRIDRISMRGLRAYTSKRASELLTARLWEPTDDGATVHDYLQWNDSREHVLKIREQGRERVRKLRGRSNAVTAREQSANAMRSYSGVVSCSSELASSSTEKGEGGLGETISERAGNFCEWYADTHLRLAEVGYIGNPRKDYEATLRMAAQFTDVELREAAIVWFGMVDDFATNGTRTITKFASRVSDCVRRARRVAS
jgi:hypothetical protein